VNQSDEEIHHFVCNDCNKRFTKCRLYVNIVYRNIHTGERRISAMFVTNDIPDKLSYSIIELKVHTGAEPNHVCIQCNTILMSKSGLLAHSRSWCHPPSSEDEEKIRMLSETRTVSQEQKPVTENLEIKPTVSSVVYKDVPAVSNRQGKEFTRAVVILHRLPEEVYRPINMKHILHASPLHMSLVPLVIDKDVSTEVPYVCTDCNKRLLSVRVKDT